MNHDNDGGRLDYTFSRIERELRNLYDSDGRNQDALDIWLSVDQEFGDEWAFPVCATDSDRDVDAWCDIYGDTPKAQAAWLYEQLTEG